MRMPSPSLDKWILCLVMLLLTWVPQELNASGEGRGQAAVVVKDGMISLATVDCPLGVLLKDIEEQSKVRFIVSHSLQEESISLQFEALPFLDGLKKILIRKSYVFLFDRSHKLVEVLVVQKREGYIPPTTPVRPRFITRSRPRNPRLNRAP